MRETKQDYVALFIDWDNLAISIAADLAGATPDVRRVVEKAQEYGTLVIARAYAEWGTLSERLSVYKAGVEPVYAPTFRFESDAITQMARGKSLADPVLVADCIETLHLLPYVSVFVLVSGDKDILPVVRLARLRGKRVVIIGPDYAANVLRELADEFVPYRSLVEAPGAALAQPEAAPTGRRGGPPPRRRPTGRPEPTRPVEVPAERPALARAEPGRVEAVTARQAEAPPAEPVAARPPRAPIQLPVRERPVRPVTWPEGPVPEAAPAAAPVAPAAAPPPAPATTPAPPVPERRPAEGEAPRESLAAVHAAMVDALRQLAAQGKTRVRATNLKDQLLARIPSFSERRYGFSKFKDFLMAAEQAGLITISMIGPVHWVSLPAFAEEAVTPEGERGPLTGRYAEIVRFIGELRQRSRWLTYTYVLNNVVNRLAREMPAEEAESEARTILNYLVTQGALQIDREPRPVEVGGVTHRVRMCHINEEHPFFRTLLAAPASAEAEKQAMPAGVGAGQPASAATLPEAAALAPASASAAPAVAEERSVAAADAPEAPRRRRSRSRRRRGGREAGVPSGEERAIAESAAAAGVAEAPAPEAARPPADMPVAAGASVESDPGEGAEQPPAEAEAEGPPEAPARDDEWPGAEAPAPETQPTDGAVDQLPALERTLADAAALVRESVSAEQTELRASTLKQRLVRRLGSFDERRYGFERFRDFLRAAEAAGLLRVRDEGRQTWVSPPSADTPETAPEPTTRRRSRRGDAAAERGDAS